MSEETNLRAVIDQLTLYLHRKGELVFRDASEDYGDGEVSLEIKAGNLIIQLDHDGAWSAREEKDSE